MVSSEHVSFINQLTTSIMLNLKPYQNLVADLNASMYSKMIQPLIVCLNYSQLKKDLTLYEDVLISALSMAYSTTIHNKSLEGMNFEVIGHKTSNSKTNFCKLLGLTPVHGTTNPNLMVSTNIIRIYFHMGYINSYIYVLSKFAKSALPPIWNALFTILFK